MAAKQGQPDAQVALGQMYENGEGVPQDYGLAAHWYRKAADHTMALGGAGVGANSLVQLYEDGHATVPTENVIALESGTVARNIEGAAWFPSGAKKALVLERAAYSNHLCIVNQQHCDGHSSDRC
jgi:TPR repeat protein